MSTDGPLVRVRRSKLIVVKDKLDAPDQNDVFMETNFNQYIKRMGGLSEKEICDRLLAITTKEEKEVMHYGLLYGILTDNVNAPKYFNQLSTLASGDSWFTALYAVNLVQHELYHKMLLSVKYQLLYLFREAIRVNASKIENVLCVFVRNLNDSGKTDERIQIATAVAQLLNDNQHWIKMLRPRSAVIFVAAYTFARYASDITVNGPFESNRQLLIQMFVWLVRNRFGCVAHLGRDLILAMMKTSKFPEVVHLWTDFVKNPKILDQHFGGLEELWWRAPAHNAFRLSIYLEKKICFMLRCKANQIERHLKWLDEVHLRNLDDNGSLRAEIIRYLLHLFAVPAIPGSDQQPPPSFHETKLTMLTHFVINATPNSVESQWMKICLWADWLGYDPAQNTLWIIEPVWSMLRQCFASNVNHMITVGNSCLEFIVKSYPTIHPPMKDRMLKSLQSALKALDPHGAGIVASVLDSVRVERSYRDLLRETFKDFVRGAPSSSLAQAQAQAGQLTPPISPVASPAPSPVASPSRPKRDNPPQSEDNDEIQEIPTTISRQPSINVDDSSTREKELSNLLPQLVPEIRPAVEKLRDVFASAGEENQSEKAEELQELIMCILKNDDVMDVEQMEIVSQCIGSIMGSIVTEGESMLPDPVTEEALEVAFQAPLFVLFRNLTMTPEGDQASRQPLVSIIAELRDTIPCVTYLLLFFLKAGRKDIDGVNSVSAYEEVAKAIDHSVEEQLSADMEECAHLDLPLFTYLVPYIFAKFSNDACGSQDFFKVVCENLDTKIAWKLMTEIIRENVTLFRKDFFQSLVLSTLNWPSNPQLMFWQLVHSEGVNIDWCTTIFGRISCDKHPEAAANVLLMLKRIDREPNMALMRAILSRIPYAGDDLVINCIKILIEDSDVCDKVAETLSNILKKQLQGGDFLMPPGRQKPKPGQKLSMEQVLSHLEYFCSNCLTKDSRSAEALLSKAPIKETFSMIKKHEKTTHLRNKYSNIFTVVDILCDDSPTSSNRTLRGNRQTGIRAAGGKREGKNSEDEPKAKKRHVVVESDSDD